MAITPAILHGDQKRLSVEIGANIRAADQMNLLTDAIVAASTSNSNMRSLIDTQLGTLHGDTYPAAQRVKRAIETGDNTTFGLTTANITDAGTTTVEIFADITDNTDGNTPILGQFLD